MIEDTMNSHEDYEFDNLSTKPRVKRKHIDLKLKNNIFENYSSKLLAIKDIWNNNKYQSDLSTILFMNEGQMKRIKNFN